MTFEKNYPKPEKGWKSSLAFGVPVIPKKNPKPIAQVGKRTKERIKEHGTESELFKHIWNTRQHFCEICSAPIPEPKPECFSHRLSKGRYPALRYMEKNVTLVCGMACHSENDRINAHRDAELIVEILS